MSRVEGFVAGVYSQKSRGGVAVLSCITPPKT